ncbi:nuclear transport factor 2 family protein [Vibrio ulleungensis]|uniref:Nuclear transport factor 2 family protein n=1 Tax=Vibrio ulleungensis TaxID=2807619 RepID=A0ABS2HGQ1_9VIBR|nr:nuclear transport factor 2 family protein [Vibrio ulleungensis]MBM7035647.1 nuclear transport factor 2 family protein [Vibrio ulleungensis]
MNKAATPKQTVLAFWDAMKSNNFEHASQFLSADFKGFWPQSNELISGRDNFVAVNSFYPAHGLWRFKINSIVADANQVVTDVSITDGVQQARAITFHVVKEGLITTQKEFWPDDMTPQPWRAKWVTLIEPE